MKNTVFPHKFWRPFLDCMPQLFFRPQYVWFPVHLKGHLIPLCYETLVVNWQNWLFTLFHQSRSVLSPNPIRSTLFLTLCCFCRWFIYVMCYYHFEGLLQDCSNSSALALELLQSCTEPSIWYNWYVFNNSLPEQRQSPTRKPVEESILMCDLCDDLLLTEATSRGYRILVEPHQWGGCGTCNHCCPHHGACGVETFHV